MSKLFNLKKWLTLEDAAKHLSIVFGEPVSAADILRLALDGQLRLSVNFVNHAMAVSQRKVPISTAKTIDIDSGVLRLLQMSVPLSEAKLIPVLSDIENPHFPVEPLNSASANSNYDVPAKVVVGIHLNEHEVLESDGQVITLEGVWDLTMIGNEQLDVEHLFQMLTGGPEVTLTSQSGTFVQNADGQICMILESFENNEFQDGSRAQLEKLKQHIVTSSIGEEEAEELLEVHKKKREKFLERSKSRPSWENYHPAGGLPKDGVLVVRTDALRDFEQSLNDNPVIADKPQSTRERDTLLKLVIGMAVKGYSHDPAATKSPAPKEIADDLAGLGISVSDDTVRKYLKQAADTVLPAKPRQS